MLLKRKAEWYRPYYVVASGKEYKVEKIHFYKDDKILVSTSSGWLENSKGVDIENLELHVDEIKVKRKVKFDGKIFVISKGKEAYGNDLISEMYIPAEMFDIHFVENKIKYKTQVRAIYKGLNDIYISTYIKSIDGKLNEIRKEYEKLFETCSGYDFAYHTESVIERIDTMKALAKQYIEEKERIENLTIDDIDIDNV